jgi:hypothetical protein
VTASYVSCVSTAIADDYSIVLTSWLSTTSNASTQLVMIFDFRIVMDIANPDAAFITTSNRDAKSSMTIHLYLWNLIFSVKTFYWEKSEVGMPIPHRTSKNFYLYMDTLSNIFPFKVLVICRWIWMKRKWNGVALECIMSIID